MGVLAASCDTNEMYRKPCVVTLPGVGIACQILERAIACNATKVARPIQQLC